MCFRRVRVRVVSIDCTAGYSCGRNSTLDACLPGQWSYSGASFCSNCTTGYYSSDYNSTQCEVCGVGITLLRALIYLKKTIY
jgi:hypothetical protein